MDWEYQHQRALDHTSSPFAKFSQKQPICKLMLSRTSCDCVSYSGLTALHRPQIIVATIELPHHALY